MSLGESDVPRMLSYSLNFLFDLSLQLIDKCLDWRVSIVLPEFPESIFFFNFISDNLRKTTEIFVDAFNIY